VYLLKPSISSLLLMALVFADQGVAQICKWVDEDGVTHYAERCPEGVESTEIELEAPPSENQIEETRERSAQSVNKRDTRSIKAFEEQPLFIPRYSKAETMKMERERQEKQCEAWRTELAELERKHEWHEIQIDLKKLLNNNKCK